MGKVEGFFILVVVAIFLGGRVVGGEVRHVVGGDRGWDPSSDIAAWSSHTTFRVGDQICEFFLSFFNHQIKLKSPFRTSPFYFHTFISSVRYSLSSLSLF